MVILASMGENVLLMDGVYSGVGEMFLQNVDHTANNVYESVFRAPFSPIVGLSHCHEHEAPRA